MSSLKENKMGTMPIGRLLLTMALPMALSMLVQALYNVVDSAFVAKFRTLIRTHSTPFRWPSRCRTS
mgnify:FL=1